MADVAEAAEEYDCVISPLLHRLFDGADAGWVAAWISHQRAEHFGLAPDGAHDQHLADTLTAWWTTRITSHARAGPGGSDPPGTST